MGLRADRGRIDVDDARLQIALRDEGLVYVTGVNRSGEAVIHAVGDGDGLVEGVERHYRHHGPEDFFLADAHLRVAIGEHGRFVEPPARVRAGLQAVAAGGQLGAFVDTDADVFHHRLKLLLVNARAHLRGGVQAVAYFQRLHASHEFFDELLVNAPLHRHTAGRRA